jgi:carboxylesterase type B
MVNNSICPDYRVALAPRKFVQKPTLIGHTESEWFRNSRLKNNFRTAGFLNVNRDMAHIHDLELMCSVARLAEEQAKKVSTWLYCYTGDFPNQKTNMASSPRQGSEVGLIFGTTLFTHKLPDTLEQVELGKNMREAWTSFAKAPGTGLDELKWPRYNPSGMFHSSMIV